MDFKLQDRVRYSGENCRLKGKDGVVLDANPLHETYLVSWSGPRYESCWVHKSCITLVLVVGGVTTPPREVAVSLSPERGMGLKDDKGKPQARLLHEGVPRALARVIDTLTFGAGKYQAHSWQHVENAAARYQDASYRHDNKRCLGEKLDPETGIHHRAHHIINELFLLELELRAEEKEEARGAE